MVNYEVRDNNGKFDVYEIGTRQVVKTYRSHIKAKDHCRQLNFGGGFDGNTPAFFMKKVQNIEYTEDSFYK